MTLTIKQTLWAAYTLLDELYKRIDILREDLNDEGLKKLLMDMDPFIFGDYTPADPALWEDWKGLAEKKQCAGMLLEEDAFQVLCLFLNENEDLYGYCADVILQELQRSHSKALWKEFLIKASEFTGENK